MSLTNTQKMRYRRQIILRDVGEKGQARLLSSKVLIVGAGGLGSPVALYLAAAGVGQIGLADHDSVDISNLQRQIIHATDKIGMSKVLSAKERIFSLNPEINVTTYHLEINCSSLPKFIEEYDLVVNVVDNTATRYVLNDACLHYQIPLIEGAINDFGGHVFAMTPGATACYNCVFPCDDEYLDSKKEIGIAGALPGIIGSIQAIEVLKILLNIGKPLMNVILYYDGLRGEFRTMKTKRDPLCTACSVLN